MTRFRAFMMAFAIYTPAFALFNTGGFLIIYLLGYLKVLETAPWQLLAIAGVSALLAAIYLPTGYLLRRGWDNLVAFIMPAGIGIFFIGLNLFWSGYLPFFYVAIWISPLLQFWQAAQARQKIIAGGVGAVATLGLYYSELARPFERMTSGSDASNFGFWFLIFAILTLIVLGLLLRVVVFRSLSTRLLASFLVIVFLPLIITTFVSGLSAQTQNEQRVRQQLNTISQLKQTQIEQITTPLINDLSAALSSAKFASVPSALTRTPLTAAYYADLSAGTEYLKEIMAEKTQYQEFFILDNTGKVFASSDETTHGRDYSRSAFFGPGLREERLTVVINSFSDLGKYGQASLIATAPILDAKDQTTIGLAAIRTRFAPIDQFMAVDPGLGTTDESYLINEQYIRITPSSAPVTDVKTQAAQAAITGQNIGTNIYLNRQGVPVIGAYRYIPSLHVAIITEISQAEAQRATRYIILANILLSLLTAGVASMAVVITARTISAPIVSLAEKVNDVSKGNLSERADIQREDEIGALANSFNSMANELQTLVTSLELRVTERTQDLEKQAARLRVASEVARDASTARSLDELLNRSAQLILDRFGFYHTGIFLLDLNREFAVLRASPTSAGQQMLARQHQLRIGETGIVGYVAATGEPRLALETGTDAAYFRNPLLPNTRSELGLPLKVEDRVIGVLDVQSEQPDAFKPEDIATLQIMADQLGIAIERTRLLQEFQQTLAEVERVYQQFTAGSWQVFAMQQKNVPGYRFEGLKLEALTQPSAEMQLALKRGAIVSNPGEGARPATLTVPVKLRGQAIGVINVKLQTNNIPADTASMLDEAAARLGFALENSRLIAESQQRASRESAIASASAKIGASRETEQIMRAAVEELQRLLGDPEVAIQLKQDLEKSS